MMVDVRNIPDPATLREMLIAAVKEHGEKRVAHEMNTARPTVSRWINEVHQPTPMHRIVIYMALVSLGVANATTRQGVSVR